MPADHVIVDQAAFQAAVRSGAALAEHGAVVTFGITPDEPELGYGYIQAGAEFANPAGVVSARHITRFVEKPDLATAQTYLDAGTYLWNSGLYMMRASVWLAACDTAWAQGKIDASLCAWARRRLASAPAIRSTMR